MTKDQALAGIVKMKTNLAEWLKYREMNDAAGVPVKRNPADEARLATDLTRLLSVVYPEAHLPMDATSLAKIAVNGLTPSSPEAQGFIPLLIGAGMVVMIAVFAIGSYSKRMAEKEKLEACKAGIETDACPRNTWMKYALIAGAAWFVLTQTKILKRLSK